MENILEILHATNYYEMNSMQIPNLRRDIDLTFELAQFWAAKIEVSECRARADHEVAMRSAAPPG